MEIKDYLQRYNREETRLFRWLKSHGVNLLVAMNNLKKYADEERKFESGSELDHVLLKESLDAEVNPFKEFIEAKDNMAKATTDLMQMQEEFMKWWMENKHLAGDKKKLYTRFKEWIRRRL